MAPLSLTVHLLLLLFQEAWSHWNQEPETWGRESSETGEGYPSLCSAAAAETPAWGCSQTQEIG